MDTEHSRTEHSNTEHSNTELSDTENTDAEHCDTEEPTWSSLLEEAVPGLCISVESLSIGPEKTSILQLTSCLARTGRPCVDAKRPVLREDDIITRKVGVDVGTLG